MMAATHLNDKRFGAGRNEHGSGFGHGGMLVRRWGPFIGRGTAGGERSRSNWRWLDGAPSTRQLLKGEAMRWSIDEGETKRRR
jgi:hypothetical protein